MMPSLAFNEEMVAVMDPSDAMESPEFLVRSRDEVLRLLNLIQTQGTLMTVNFLNVDHVAVTSLIYADEASNMLLMECPPQWQHILDTGGGDSVMIGCMVEDSKIQFQGSKGMIVDLDGKAVVGLALPEFMWRFQRRCDPRHSVTGLTITLNLGFIECDAQVTDLSMGGIGMVNCNSDVKLEAGEVLSGCSIALPGVGQIAVDMTVQHQALVVTADGTSVARLGCQFNGLNDSARQLIAHCLDALSDT